MTRIFVSLLLTLWFVSSAGAQQADCQPVLTAGGSGKVVAKADLAVLFMMLKSSGSMAADAVNANAKKAEDVRARLSSLGLSNRLRIGNARVTPAGGPYYSNPRPQFTGYEVVQWIYVSFEGKDLEDDTALDRRAGTVIDELTRAGASLLETAVPRLCSNPTCSMMFTVKDPTAQVRQAREEAIANARLVAEEEAKDLGSALGDLRSLQSSTNVNSYSPGFASPLDDLPYEYVSLSRNVSINVTASIQYTLAAGAKSNK